MSAFGKIDLIKIFKTLTGFGLVDSKYAVEAWLNAHVLCAVENIRQLRSFVFYANAFANDEIALADNNTIVFTKPRTLSIGDIKAY